MSKKVSLLVFFVLVLSLFTGCSFSVNRKVDGSKSNTVKVGLDYELSGDGATYGQACVEGIELGMEEINKTGGVLGKQVELVKSDNKTDNAETASIATRLATRDKVVAILGAAFSGNTKSAANAANQNKVPLISCSSTSDDVTVDSNGKVRQYVFRTCFTDSFQGVIGADFAFDDLNSKNAAVLIDSTSDYSKGLAKNFKEVYTKKGGNIVTEQAYQQKDKDFKAVLTKIKSSNPDLIYIPGYVEEVGLIVKQARELGLDVPILGGDGFDSPKFVEISGKDALNNVYFTNHYSPKDDSPEVVKFKESFKSKYGKDPDAFNALGYDLAYFLKDAIERAGAADPVKVKDALASTKDFKGITGSMSVDSKHNPVKSATVVEFKNGEQDFVKKVEP